MKPISILIFLVCMVFGTPSEAQVVYSPLGCSFSGASIPVYFNPGTLAANNFDPDIFRESLIDAIATWREESMSSANLYFAGDSTATDNIPGALLVVHQNNWFCSDNAAAKAFYASSGDCATNGTIIRVIMRDSCTNVVRPWTPFWPGNGSSGGINYEAVLIHELGHAAFGFPDTTLSTGVMHKDYNLHARYLAISAIDARSAVTQYGWTGLFPLTMSSSNAGVSWSSTSLYESTTSFSPFPPALDTRYNTSIPTQGVNVFSYSATPQFRRGDHAAFSGHGSSPPTPETWSQATLAYSTYGEILALHTTDCDLARHCSLQWMWSNNQGASWSTGVIAPSPAVGTFARAEAAYDVANDRFVVVYIRGDSARPYSTWTYAASPVWSTPIYASLGEDPMPLRHMGGLVFDNAGTGLLVASAFRDNGPALGALSVLSPIVQMQVTLEPSGYRISNASYARSYTWRSLARTRRNFGLARSPEGQIVMAWRGTSSLRRLMISRKTSIASTSLFSAEEEQPITVTNGVDIGYSQGSSSFVVGFPW